MSPASRSFSLDPANEAPAGVVLLIEDEEYLARMLQIVFTRAGYAFLWARNGVEALRLVADHGDRIVFALVDWYLPDMGGGELSRQLRLKVPALPLLLTSGQALDFDPELDAGGPTAFIAKPFLPSRLLERVRQLLHAVVMA